MELPWVTLLDTFLGLLTQHSQREKIPSAEFLLMVHMAKSLSFGMHPFILDSFH